jgi:hypothetical protein
MPILFIPVLASYANREVAILVPEEDFLVPDVLRIFEILHSL